MFLEINHGNFDFKIQWWTWPFLMAVSYEYIKFHNSQKWFSFLSNAPHILELKFRKLKTLLECLYSRMKLTKNPVFLHYFSKFMEILIFVLKCIYISFLLKMINGFSWPAKIMVSPFNLGVILLNKESITHGYWGASHVFIFPDNLFPVFTISILDSQQSWIFNIFLILIIFDISIFCNSLFNSTIHFLIRVFSFFFISFSQIFVALSGLGMKRAFKNDVLSLFQLMVEDDQINRGHVTYPTCRSYQGIQVMICIKMLLPL